MEKTPCWILIRRLTRVDEYVCSECRTAYDRPWIYCPTCRAETNCIRTLSDIPYEEPGRSWDRR